MKCRICDVPALNSARGLPRTYFLFFLNSCAIKQHNFLFKRHFKPGAHRGNESSPCGRAKAPQTGCWEIIRFRGAVFYGATNAKIRAPIRVESQQRALVAKVSPSFAVAYEMTAL